MKKVIFFFIALLIITITNTYSQTEGSSFKAGAFSTTYLTDYQSLGVNPANLGWQREDKSVHLSFLEFGLSVFSDAIPKTELREEFITKLMSEDEFTLQEKIEAASNFLSHGLALNLDIALFSFSFQNEAFGGVGFSVREKTVADFKFNDKLASFLFLGAFDSSLFTKFINPTDSTLLGIPNKNTLYSEVFEDARMSMNSYLEFVFGYGRKLVDNDMLKLYAGIDFKYLKGLAIADMGTVDGEFRAYTALSPRFNIEYPQDVITGSPSYTEEGLFVGKGFGVDLGVTVEIQNLKAAIAVNDIGSITWDGNVINASDDFLDTIEFTGFDNYNLVWEAQKIWEGDGVFQWHGEEKKKVNLPTNVRLGASYTFIEKFEIGMDVYIPASNEPGSFENAVFGFGANIKPIPWVELSAGFVGGGITDYSIPAGICFSVAKNSWETGVSTRDILTWLKQTSPHLSASFGFLRFRF